MTDDKIKTVLALAERLSAVLAADIEALEAGRAREMKSITPEMQQLIAQYGREAARLSRTELEAAPAELRGKLTAATKRFQDTLKLHTRVLTRIKNASEGMIKAVADEVEKRRNRAKPYSAPYGGKPAAPRPASSSLLYNAVV